MPLTTLAVDIINKILSFLTRDDMFICCRTNSDFMRYYLSLYYSRNKIYVLPLPLPDYTIDLGVYYNLYLTDRYRALYKGFRSGDIIYNSLYIPSNILDGKIPIRLFFINDNMRVTMPRNNLLTLSEDFHYISSYHIDNVKRCIYHIYTNDEVELINKNLSLIREGKDDEKMYHKVIKWKIGQFKSEIDMVTKINTVLEESIIPIHHEDFKLDWYEVKCYTRLVYANVDTCIGKYTLISKFAITKGIEHYAHSSSKWSVWQLLSKKLLYYEEPLLENIDDIVENIRELFNNRIVLVQIYFTDLS